MARPARNKDSWEDKQIEYLRWLVEPPELKQYKTLKEFIVNKLWKKEIETGDITYLTALRRMKSWRDNPRFFDALAVTSYQWMKEQIPAINRAMVGFLMKPENSADRKTFYTNVLPVLQNVDLMARALDAGSLLNEGKKLDENEIITRLKRLPPEILGQVLEVLSDESEPMVIEAEEVLELPEPGSQEELESELAAYEYDDVTSADARITERPAYYPRPNARGEKHGRWGEKFREENPDA